MTPRSVLLVGITASVLSVAQVGDASAALYQWLDSSAAGSVVTDVNGFVTGWLDQSGNGNDATNGSGNITDTAAPGIQFGGGNDQYLDMLAGPNGSGDGVQGADVFLNNGAGYSLILAYREDLTNALSNWNDMLTNQSGVAGNGRFLIRTPNGGGASSAADIGKLQLRIGGGSYTAPTPPPALNDGELTVLGITVDASGAMTLRSNRGLSADSVAGSFFINGSNTNPLQLGAQTDAANNRYFIGDYYEIKVWDADIGVSELSSQVGQLHAKWAAPEPSSLPLLLGGVLFAAVRRIGQVDTGLPQGVAATAA